MAAAVLLTLSSIAADAREHDPARGGPVKWGKAVIAAGLRRVDFDIPAGTALTIPSPYTTRRTPVGIEVWGRSRRVSIIPTALPPTTTTLAMAPTPPVSLTVLDRRLQLAPVGLPPQRHQRVGAMDVVELE